MNRRQFLFKSAAIVTATSLMPVKVWMPPEEIWTNITTLGNMDGVYPFMVLGDGQILTARQVLDAEAYAAQELGRIARRTVEQVTLNVMKGQKYELIAESVAGVSEPHSDVGGERILIREWGKADWTG